MYPFTFCMLSSVCVVHCYCMYYLLIRRWLFFDFNVHICYMLSPIHLVSVEIFGNNSMAFSTFKVPYAVKILPKISTGWVGFRSVTDRQVYPASNEYQLNAAWLMPAVMSCWFWFLCKCLLLVLLTITLLLLAEVCHHEWWQTFVFADDVS